MIILTNITISANYARAIVYGAPRRGVDPAALLEMSGIYLDPFAETQARLSAESFIKLYKNAWREMDDEFLGRTSSPCKVGAFHLIGSLSVYSANLKEIINLYIRYFHLFSNDLELTLYLHDDEVELSLAHSRPEFDQDNFLVEWLLVVLYRIFGWFIGKKIIVNKACFTHPMPENPEEYRYTFPCKVSFDSPRNSIFFSSAHLMDPVNKSIKDFNAFIKNSPKDLLILGNEDRTLVNKVRLLFKECPVDRLPTLDWVAERLHTTPYTLSRKLSAEGLSYQKIKDNYRKDKSIVMLTQQNVSVREISDRLGFSEPGAFSRAFRQWTGVTPMIYRKAHRKRKK